MSTNDNRKPAAAKKETLSITILQAPKLEDEVFVGIMKYVSRYGPFEKDGKEFGANANQLHPQIAQNQPEFAAVWKDPDNKGHMKVLRIAKPLVYATLGPMDGIIHDAVSSMSGELSVDLIAEFITNVYYVDIRTFKRQIHKLYPSLHTTPLSSSEDEELCQLKEHLALVEWERDQLQQEQQDQPRMQRDLALLRGQKSSLETVNKSMNKDLTDMQDALKKEKATGKLSVYLC